MVSICLQLRARVDHLVLTEFTTKSQKKRNYVGREPVIQLASLVFRYTIQASGN